MDWFLFQSIAEEVKDDIHDGAVETMENYEFQNKHNKTNEEQERINFNTMDDEDVDMIPADKTVHNPSPTNNGFVEDDSAHEIPSKKKSVHSKHRLAVLC